MRLTRSFVDRPLRAGDTLALPAAAAAHLVRVLRLQPGDACVLFNGDGHDYDARLVSVGKREVRAEVVAARRTDNESPLAITLVQGIARGEKMDWILQKATELGVAAIVPVASERSEVRLDGERADKRATHWHEVVVAACGQSGRATVPPVSAPQPLTTAVARLPAGARRLLLDPQAAHGLDAGVAAADGIVLAIGPEGGWSVRDLATLRDHGFAGLRLGPRVLRTETAGLAAIAALQALHGDLG